MSGLHAYGRPMRALHLLAAAIEPLGEHDLWDQAKRLEPNAVWHYSLRALVRAGYATRSGERGRYRYEITSAGRDLLQARA